MTRTLISSGSKFEKEIGYSRAVVQGPWCFVAGTTGFDYAAMTISDDGSGGDLGYPSTVELSDRSFLTVWYEALKKGQNAVLRQARWRIDSATRPAP